MLWKIGEWERCRSYDSVIHARNSEIQFWQHQVFTSASFKYIRCPSSREPTKGEKKGKITVRNGNKLDTSPNPFSEENLNTANYAPQYWDSLTNCHSWPQQGSLGQNKVPIIYNKLQSDKAWCDNKVIWLNAFFSTAKHNSLEHDNLSY